RLTLNCADLDKDILKKKELSRQNVENLESCLKDVSGFTKLEVDQQNVENGLENFASLVRELTKQVDDKLVEFKSLQNTFKIETRELSCTLNEKDPEATGRELEVLQSKAKGKITQLREALKNIDLDNPEAEKFRLKRYLVDARAAWGLSDQ